MSGEISDNLRRNDRSPVLTAKSAKAADRVAQSIKDQGFGLASYLVP